MPTVELRFTAMPAHVRTARLVATSLARQAGVDEETLDEVRLAVAEACARAVRLHDPEGDADPVLLRMTDGDGRFVVEVHDAVPPGAGPERVVHDGDAVGQALQDLLEHADGRVRPDDDPFEDPLPEGVDLAVIRSLTGGLEVEQDADGTLLRMTWEIDRPDREGSDTDGPVFGRGGPSA